MVQTYKHFTMWYYKYLCGQDSVWEGKCWTLGWGSPQCLSNFVHPRDNLCPEFHAYHYHACLYNFATYTYAQKQ